ncbi:MAG TPA: CRTAC1 family protein [Terriglobia bacterium]|nr:CRTAC1 family protein [Terriglobia bacterium]
MSKRLSRRQILQGAAALAGAPWLRGRGEALAIDAGVKSLAARAAPLTTPYAGVTFVDVGKQAGLVHETIFGGKDKNLYLLETTGCGVAFFDYDNDGWLDIFVVNGTRLEEQDSGLRIQDSGSKKSEVRSQKPGNQESGARSQESGNQSPTIVNRQSTIRNPTNHLYKNNRDGTFTDVTEKAGLIRGGWGQGVCVGDYDNDGFDDLFVTYWGKNVLYHNNGDGTFTDVSEKAGVAGARTRWSTGCAFVDYDRDGHLDLFVANYIDLADFKSWPLPESGPCMFKSVQVACGPPGLPGAKNILYRNNGDGTFTDVSEKSGITQARGTYGLGVLCADFDNDGWPDIYVANDSQPSALYRNNHDGTFTDIGIVAGVAYSQDGKPQAGMGVAAADYDCDGWLDIFRTNFSEDTSSLYHNTGQGAFDDVTFPAGLGMNTRYLGWGCAFLDIDNDGWADIFVCNGHIYPEIKRLSLDIRYEEPKIVYYNLKNGRFKDVSKELGGAILEPTSTRGCAVGDFDNDGDLDIVTNPVNGYPQLLRCDSIGPQPGGNHWLKIRAIGTKSNRSGIGARITCITNTHRQIDEVRSGGGYASQNDLRVHFGLGQATKADRIEIRWPSGQVDTLENVASDQVVYVQEGKGIIKFDSISKK